VYDEDRKIYHQKKPGDPQWIQDMIYACHYNGMLPDDFVFEQVYKFCSEISQLDPDDDPADIEIYADDYTHDRLKWMCSNLGRLDYVDDAIDEYFDSNGDRSDIAVFIGIAREKEMRDILYTIIDKLEDRIDELQDEEIDLFHEVCKDEVS
jgi:hypothetical protein